MLPMTQWLCCQDHGTWTSHETVTQTSASPDLHVIPDSHLVQFRKMLSALYPLLTVVNINEQINATNPLNSHWFCCCSCLHEPQPWTGVANPDPREQKSNKIKQGFGSRWLGLATPGLRHIVRHVLILWEFFKILDLYKPGHTWTRHHLPSSPQPS